jgi:hypothetical protein
LTFVLETNFDGFANSEESNKKIREALTDLVRENDELKRMLRKKITENTKLTDMNTKL